jgi:hypothetical protein
VVDISRPGVHKFVLLNVDGDQIGRAKEIVEKGEAPGWPMPVILSVGGKTKKESAMDAVRNVGAWGLDVDTDADVDVVEFVKAIKA